jgi:hypothetical protein
MTSKRYDKPVLLEFSGTAANGVETVLDNDNVTGDKAGYIGFDYFVENLYIVVPNTFNATIKLYFSFAEEPPTATTGLYLYDGRFQYKAAVYNPLTITKNENTVVNVVDKPVGAKWLLVTGTGVSGASAITVKVSTQRREKS